MEAIRGALTKKLYLKVKTFAKQGEVGPWLNFFMDLIFNYFFEEKIVKEGDSESQVEGQFRFG